MSVQQLPTALILKWNSRTLRARCPYCLFSHGHGTSTLLPLSNVSRNNVRKSDCANGDYLLVFPQTNNPATAVYGWEVDQDNCEFVTVNQQGAVPVPINNYQDGRTLLPEHEEQHQITTIIEDSDDGIEDSDDGTKDSDDGIKDSDDGIDDLITTTDSLKLGNHTEEQEPTPKKTCDEIWEELCLDASFRKKLYISHCVRREIRELELLCRKYAGDRLIRCVDDEGSTGALLASTEENGVETLRWLHEHGVSIDRADHYGRTPLMEAALWGRLDTVQYLIKHGVDLIACDGNRMQAADLAADTDRNAKERRVRSGGIYREPSDASRHRQLIAALLARHMPPRVDGTYAGPALERRACFNRRADGKLEIYRPQGLVESPSGRFGHQKAFATLDRGSNYPYINAMSGYSHTGWPNVLDNAAWTDKAEELRKLLGLPKDRPAASHVEPQLLAYLLHRHSLHLTEPGDAEGLAEAMPIYTLKPIITVSKPDLCARCIEFFEKLKQKFPGLCVVFHCVGESSAAILHKRD